VIMLDNRTLGTNRMPLIGIPCREETVRSASFVGMFRSYVDSVVQAGAAPFLIPLLRENAGVRQLYDMADAIMLCGGEDIEPRCYGEEIQAVLTTTSPARDQIELDIVLWAIDDGKPLLGICRGMHVINVALKGTLYQDLSTQYPASLEHHLSGQREPNMGHEIRLDPNSKFAALLGAEVLFVNSRHHQAVKEIGRGLKAAARAPDGVIEAIEHSQKPFVLGVQCHPELLSGGSSSNWRDLFCAFADAARQCSLRPEVLVTSAK